MRSYIYIHMKIHRNHKEPVSSLLPHITPSLFPHIMMTSGSAHQSNTSSFKPRRIKTMTKPPRQINNKEPSSPATTQPVLKCPRCDSVNTKFCYYNNYSLSQPRHYCKNCRRYWTRGGALRNVPVGGSTRNKNKPGSLHVISSPPLFSNVTSTSSRELVRNHPSTTTMMMMSSGGFSSYMFPLEPNYNLASSSSIESLSSFNQDLHQKLQQQRLIASMIHQDSLPVNEKPVMFQNGELIPPSTEWGFDRSAMGGGGATSGSHGDNGDGEGNLENWYHNVNNNAML